MATIEARVAYELVDMTATTDSNEKRRLMASVLSLLSKKELISLILKLLENS